MIPQSICFLDIETSGMNPNYSRIIEIGVVKVQDGKIVKKYNQLINPQTVIDPFIKNLTGINGQMLEDSPTFYDIKDELLDILKDSTIAAHSVRFDYGFLRNEFKRIGISFNSKHFCTVKLARLLYPNQKKYNLDSIIENFGIECLKRHRAFDDAKVIYDFFVLSQKNIKKELFEQALNIALKRPTIPTNLNLVDLDKIPEGPGVYIFYGDNNIVLYVGKSINLRDRVLSHFSNDYLSSTDMKISQQVKSFEVIETAGELSALLLESTLIKKHQPLFNRLLRNSAKMNILMLDESKGYKTIKFSVIDKILVSDLENILGVFKSQKQMKDFLGLVAKEFKLCPKVLGLEKSKNYCFNFHLGFCKGACMSEENSLKYNLRFEEAFYKSKIKPWRFDSPIIIKEIGEKEEIHVIDKWCYLGSLKSEQDSISDLKQEYNFDFDTYKILSRYINNDNNQNYIKTINLDIT
jgi:DNA polymerase-3 subunit epsilon